MAFLGKPNAGKSTLLNRILGEKLAAVSPLPQTTRERFLGIHSEDDCQIVFVDLPGMIGPTDRLNEILRANVLDNLNEVDVVVHLVDVDDPAPLSGDMAEALRAVRTPLLFVLNKLDGKKARVDARSWMGEHLPEGSERNYAAILGVSAREGAGLDELLAEIRQRLPLGEPLYDPESLTDRDMRYLAQEMIREKAYAYLHEELPYATAVLIDDFKERDRGKWYIGATIYVERDTQKGIVIGHRGETLKKISTAARTDIERLCGAPVFLELWVKVRPKWRKNDADLRMFGLTPPPKKKRRKGG